MASEEVHDRGKYGILVVLYLGSIVNKTCLGAKVSRFFKEMNRILHFSEKSPKPTFEIAAIFSQFHYLLVK